MLKKVTAALAMAMISAGAALADPAVISPKSYQDTMQHLDYDAHTVDAVKFTQLAGKKDTVILDLRSSEAYAHSHIQGAKHLGSDINEKKIQKLVPSKEATILLYCENSIAPYPMRNLALTTSSLPQFIALGYKNTYNLQDINRQSEENKNLILKMMK